MHVSASTAEAAGRSDWPSLKIAMLAPPWISVRHPPTAASSSSSLLAGELTRRGNDVTLFAAPGSRSDAAVQEVLEAAHPDQIQIAIFEADHVARSFDRIDDAAETGRPFDAVHDHSGFTAPQRVRRACR